ncbi:putative dephospho-CoA kinase [Helianthus debilis subsp. tardiflorus]
MLRVLGCDNFGKQEDISSILGCFVCPFPKSYLAVQPRIFVKTGHSASLLMFQIASSVAYTLFKANGIPVVDADIIARAWVEEGCREDILLESGELDQPKLGRIVSVIRLNSSFLIGTPSTQTDSIR